MFLGLWMHGMPSKVVVLYLPSLDLAKDWRLKQEKNEEHLFIIFL